MKTKRLNRRGFIEGLGAAVPAVALRGGGTGGAQAIAGPSELLVDPCPRFALAPCLYMQLMEPLGVADGSMYAARDFGAQRWREEVVESSQGLAPTLLRWGGCCCSYYCWKEGVGLGHRRKPMRSQLWGGVYDHQVGTHELVDFCRRIGADPLLVGNFESGGRRQWATDSQGNIRLGEAAEWMDCCENPANAQRRERGAQAPYGVTLWQIGNETSSDPNGFGVEDAARKPVGFAKAMRPADHVQAEGGRDAGPHWLQR